MLVADVTFEKHLFPFPPASVRPECQRVPVRLPCVFLNHLSVKVSQPPHPLPRLPQCQIKRQKKRKNVRSWMLPWCYQIPLPVKSLIPP